MDVQAMMSKLSIKTNKDTRLSQEGNVRIVNQKDDTDKDSPKDFLHLLEKTDDKKGIMNETKEKHHKSDKEDGTKDDTDEEKVNFHPFDISKRRLDQKSYHIPVIDSQPKKKINKNELDQIDVLDGSAALGSVTSQAPIDPIIHLDNFLSQNKGNLGNIGLGTNAILESKFFAKQTALDSGTAFKQNSFSNVRDESNKSTQKPYHSHYSERNQSSGSSGLQSYDKQENSSSSSRDDRTAPTNSVRDRIKNNDAMQKDKTHQVLEFSNAVNDTKTKLLNVGDKILLKSFVNVGRASQIDSVSLLSQKKQGDVQSLRLQLHPHSLGTVDIRMKLSRHGMHVTLRAANSETATLLAQDRYALKHILESTALSHDHKFNVVILNKAGQVIAELNQSNFDTSNNKNGQDRSLEQNNFLSQENSSQKNGQGRAHQTEEDNFESLSSSGLNDELDDFEIQSNDANGLIV